ncbi:TPA: hypothetical protein HA265_04225, partial [Candidatus Woesearchaeota archaeon]|nr:hypothetical protein [Candidatus Woesearchaeota archaeon]
MTLDEKVRRGKLTEEQKKEILRALEPDRKRKFIRHVFEDAFGTEKGYYNTCAAFALPACLPFLGHQSAIDLYRRAMADPEVETRVYAAENLDRLIETHLGHVDKIEDI